METRNVELTDEQINVIIDALYFVETTVQNILDLSMKPQLVNYQETLENVNREIIEALLNDDTTD